MAAKSSADHKRSQFLALGLLGLAIALGCGGSGGDKAQDACEDLIDALAACFGGPLSQDDYDEAVDICENELIEVAEEAGGGVCVDAVIDLIDCIIEVDCELIEQLLEGNFEDMAFPECQDEVEGIATSCEA